MEEIGTESHTAPGIQCAQDLGTILFPLPPPPPKPHHWLIAIRFSLQVEKYYSDFMNDVTLLKCLEAFAKKVLVSGMSNQILRLLQQVHHPIHTHITLLSLFVSLPSSLKRNKQEWASLWYNINSAKRHHILRYPKICFLHRWRYHI